MYSMYTLLNNYMFNIYIKHIIYICKLINSLKIEVKPQKHFNMLIYNIIILMFINNTISNPTSWFTQALN